MGWSDYLPVTEPIGYGSDAGAMMPTYDPHLFRTQRFRDYFEAMQAQKEAEASQNAGSRWAEPEQPMEPNRGAGQMTPTTDPGEYSHLRFILDSLSGKLGQQWETAYYQPESVANRAESRPWERPEPGLEDQFGDLALMTDPTMIGRIGRMGLKGAGYGLPLAIGMTGSEGKALAGKLGTTLEDMLASIPRFAGKWGNPASREAMTPGSFQQYAQQGMRRGELGNTSKPTGALMDDVWSSPQDLERLLGDWERGGWSTPAPGAEGIESTLAQNINRRTSQEAPAGLRGMERRGEGKIVEKITSGEDLSSPFVREHSFEWNPQPKAQELPPEGKLVQAGKRKWARQFEDTSPFDMSNPPQLAGGWLSELLGGSGRYNLNLGSLGESGLWNRIANAIPEKALDFATNHPVIAGGVPAAAMTYVLQKLLPELSFGNQKDDSLLQFVSNPLVGLSPSPPSTVGIQSQDQYRREQLQRRMQDKIRIQAALDRALPVR